MVSGESCPTGDVDVRCPSQGHGFEVPLEEIAGVALQLSLFESEPFDYYRSYIDTELGNVCFVKYNSSAVKGAVKGAVYNRIQRIRRSMFMIRKCCVVSAQGAFSYFIGLILRYEPGGSFVFYGIVS